MTADVRLMLQVTGSKPTENKNTRKELIKYLRQEISKTEKNKTSRVQGKKAKQQTNL